MCAYGCTVISVGKARVVGTVADQNAAFFQPCGKSFRSLKEQIICTGIPYGKTCFFQFCFHPGAFFSDQFPCFFDISILVQGGKACHLRRNRNIPRLHAAADPIQQILVAAEQIAKTQARHCVNLCERTQNQQIRIFVQFSLHRHFFRLRQKFYETLIQHQIDVTLPAVIQDL